MPRIADQLRFQAGDSFEDEATFTCHDGKLYAAVAEEQAVDSYNQMFTCNHTFTREQALALRDWLTAKFDT